MAKCIKCGKKGLFLRLDQNGLCTDCAKSSSAASIQGKEPEQNKGFQSTLYPNAAGLFPKEILVFRPMMPGHRLILDSLRIPGKRLIHIPKLQIRCSMRIPENLQ